MAVKNPIEAPPGHELVDKAWEEWKPSTPGAQKFKETIDMIEQTLT